MPPVRTLLFLVPLVKALRPSTTPAKQLSTASSMKARVASQKAAGGNAHSAAVLFGNVLASFRSGLSDLLCSSACLFPGPGPLGPEAQASPPAALVWFG